MASSRDRKRALARAKLERQMARRAAAARRRRQIQAGIASAVALVLVVAAIVWAIVEFADKEDEPQTSTSPAPCQFEDVSVQELERNHDLKDTPKPDESMVVREGVRILTLNTNHGTIKIELDADKSPCNVANIAHLTLLKFYDNTSCHRLTTDRLYVLQCGDPSGTGSGGPTYRTQDEYLPLDDRPTYPKGIVAMANSGPNTNGSQMFLVYKDTELPPDYTIVGEIIEGMEVVEKIAADGVADGSTDGKPKTTLTIETATVSEPQERQLTSTPPSPSPTASPSGAPASSAPAKS